MRNISAVLLLAGLLASTATADDPPLSIDAAVLIQECDAPLEPEIAVRESTPAPGLEVGLQYLLWWLREGRIPAVLTTSSQASQGVLGQPDTRVLYGNERLPTRHGDRFNGPEPTLAYWFDDAHTVGIEARAFFFERDSTYFKAVSDGSALLARPYIAADCSPASEVIAGVAPTGLRSGGFIGYSRIELYGEEANAVGLLLSNCGFRVELIGGVRFLQMRDRTDLTSSGKSLPDQATIFGLEDDFRTGNAYYGGQLGLRGQWSYGGWSLELSGEMGLGANEEQVRAFGRSIYQTPFQRLITPTGLAVQASNTGIFDRTALNEVGQFCANLSYQFTQHIQAIGGYSFLVWDGVLRSGDQIDPVVNTGTGVTPARPAISFKSDVFWAQGLNAGVKLMW
jgi:hypothetical protein